MSQDFTIHTFDAPLSEEWERKREKEGAKKREKKKRDMKMGKSEQEVTLEGEQ